MYFNDTMAKFTRFLKNKLNALTAKLGENDTFTVSDAVSVLEMKETSVRWTLWNLADLGKIVRLGHGVYSLRPQEKQIARPQLSPLARKAKSILEESGILFFISGLDILAGYMIHVPEKYPVMAFIEQTSIEDAQELLMVQKIDSIISPKINEFKKFRNLPSLGEIVILRKTKEFNYSYEGLAEPEKAFVDLYYEVTRASYPLSLGELGRIYLNMRRRGSLNDKRLSKIAIRRSLHYDIRFVLNYEKISEHAFEFTKILKNLEKE